VGWDDDVSGSGLTLIDTVDACLRKRKVRREEGGRGGATLTLRVIDEWDGW
jgi:hypothetical protein